MAKDSMSNKKSQHSTTPWLPGEEGVLTDLVLKLVRQAQGQGLTTNEAESALEQYPPEEIEASLGELGDEGTIVRRRGRWTALEKTSFRRGKVLREGRDLLIKSDQGQIYPCSATKDRPLEEGDGVLFEIHRRRNGKSEGRVTEVLSSRPRLFVGLRVEEERGRVGIVAFDTKDRTQYTLARESEDLPEYEYGVFERLDRNPNESRTRVRLREKLGDPRVPQVASEIALRAFNLPSVFPSAVIREAADSAKKATQWGKDRRDFRDVLTVTIDGESTRDFDDAISIEKSPKGFKVFVHIADVAHFVPEGSTVDWEAYNRGTSVYFPNRVLPMLPESLSNGVCSLVPGEDRLVLTIIVSLDPAGVVQSTEFTNGVIRSDHRLTYGQVGRILEGQESCAGDTLELITYANDLTNLLSSRRRERGALEFDRPDVMMHFDDEGLLESIEPYHREQSHRIIEELMILANEAVASRLEKAGIQLGGLFRNHPAPKEEYLDEVGDLLASLGVSWPGSRAIIQDVRLLQAVVDALRGTPEEEIAALAILRAQQRAVYSPESHGHWGLASSDYLHATSPIRRYPDLVVHRRLKDLLKGESFDPNQGVRAVTLGARSTEREIRGEKAEREVKQWMTVLALEEYVGETFHAQITGVMPFGLFVLLENLSVDGLAHISTFPERMEFDESQQLIRGVRSGTTYRLGEKVEVQLNEVDPIHRGLRVEVLPLNPP